MEIEKSKQKTLKPATSKDFTHFKVIDGPEILRKYTGMQLNNETILETIKIKLTNQVELIDLILLPVFF
jgi:hypothetical protein